MQLSNIAYLLEIERKVSVISREKIACAIGLLGAGFSLECLSYVLAIL